MENPQSPGDVIQLTALRSPEWLERTKAIPGATIQIYIPEWELEGPATILSVTPCGPIDQDGVGRIVLTTVTHLNGNVRELRLSDGESLYPTGRHRLFSIDRQAWVETSTLCAGERLKTRDGTRTIP